MKRHPTTHKSLAPKQTNIPFTPEYLDDPEKLIIIARKHFATRFPNKRRTGCPAPGVIQSACADQPPSDELRDHLLRCSECFNEYSAALRNYHQQTGGATATGNWRTKLKDALSRWRLPLFVSAAASVLLTVGLFIQRRRQTEAPQSSYTRSQPAPVASAGNPPTPAPPAPTTRPTPDPMPAPMFDKSRPAESLAINVDLNRYSALGDAIRGASLREEERKIKLPPRRALLKLRLRRGSEAGRYRISIVDPNSNRLIQTIARSHDGKSLNAILNLRRAARTAHRLRVERGDDMNEYLIEISTP